MCWRTGRGGRSTAGMPLPSSRVWRRTWCSVASRVRRTFQLRNYGHAEQIGLEETPADYVAKMVEVFREVRRVLRPDGTLWLNLGSSYARNPAKGQHKPGDSGKQSRAYDVGGGRASATVTAGFSEKNLIGIPWMVAFALQADGWCLRSDIIWHKPNVCPESVEDRCTKSHEYVFMLAKSPRYYFDAKAIAEEATSVGGGASFGKQRHDATGTGQQSRKYDRPVYKTRNKRSVWSIPTKSYKGAHFAVMPEALVKPCVLAGSRKGDIVLDPFMGSGTVASVAVSLDRRAIGSELNPAYIPLIEERMAKVKPSLFAA